jgi:hypothetical protein
MTWKRTKRPKHKQAEIWGDLTPKQKYSLAVSMARKSPHNTGTLRRLQRLMKKVRLER